MENIVNLYSKEEFLACLNLEASVLEEWEKIGLLRPSGKYDANSSYYNEKNIDEAKKIKSLMDLDFDCNTILKIKNKIGLPSSDKAPNIPEKFITIGELSEKSGIGVRAIKYWEEKDLIKPEARFKGGVRLYRESYVEICYRIRELQLLGYTVEELKKMHLLFLPQEMLVKELNNYKEEEREKILEDFSHLQKELAEKINDLNRALKRWQTIAKMQAKLTAGLRKRKKN